MGQWEIEGNELTPSPSLLRNRGEYIFDRGLGLTRDPRLVIKLKRRETMRIGIIGAGRAGGALGLALAAAGHAVTGVCDPAPGKAEDLAVKVGAEVRGPVGIVEAAEIVLLSVPDEVIAAAAADLAAAVTGKAEGKVFLHLSGAHPAGLLRPLRKYGTIGSMHPLLPLAAPESGAACLRGCWFALEGEAAAVATAEQLVLSLDGHVIKLRAADKTRYHAAAVIVSNYMVGLVDIALQLYATLGLSRDEARAAIQPLLEGTLANLRDADPRQALTGPISRGDLTTIEEHLRDLAGGPQQAEAVYRTLGMAVLDLARGAGRIDDRQAGSVKALLKGDGKSGGGKADV